jgi:hypothetical protein
MDIVKSDYPQMVSGLEKRYTYGYKFATLTVIGKDTPIVLAVEPVKEASEWETEEIRTPIVEVVARLLSTAREYVDIHKVLADRTYDVRAVRDHIDTEGLTYLIPKRRYAAEWRDIEDIQSTDGVDSGVQRTIEHGYQGRVHRASIMYVPSRKHDGKYAVFTTNRDVPPNEIESLVASYRDRWTIENEYKSIKENFLPQTSSKDYRVRLFYFLAGVLMYNVWRVTNLILRDVVDVHLGKKPPVPAGEIAEVLAFFLDPGG